MLTSATTRRIPQYYAEEATKAVMPLLGESYHADKQRSFWICMWESFTQCQYVESDDPAAKPENRAMWYKGGPMPNVELIWGEVG
jgi:bifunctional Delta-12/omega-3 fatty acid desaturase